MEIKSINDEGFYINPRSITLRDFPPSFILLVLFIAVFCAIAGYGSSFFVNAMLFGPSFIVMCLNALVIKAGIIREKKRGIYQKYLEECEQRDLGNALDGSLDEYSKSIIRNHVMSVGDLV